VSVRYGSIADINERMLTHMPESPIRVTLCDVPPLLRDLVTRMLHDDPDFEIVGIGDGESPSLVAARAERASILITTLPSAATDPSLRAVVQAQPLTILVLRPDRKSCLAVTLSHREISLDGENMVDLPKTLREAAKRSFSPAKAAMGRKRTAV
jgi:hypothetical protein